MSSTLPVEFAWLPDANTGWGLFGLHLALGLARCGRNVYLPQNMDFDGIPLTLWPALRQMMEPGDRSERRITLYANGNHFGGPVGAVNRATVSLTVFEDSDITEKAVQHLRMFDLVIAPSRWCAAHLERAGVSATLWHQGYDRSLFHPAPRRRPNDGKFLIFSGGKLEYRKGQDIVVAAFKRFLETPDGKGAILVTAWQNKWPKTMEGIWQSGYVNGVPAQRLGSLDITSWLNANGIAPEHVMDLGWLSQPEMANAMRECDVATFASRAEGAHNMSASEAIGLGLPTLCSSGTGHQELLGYCGLASGQPVASAPPPWRGTDGWSETDPDEIVDWWCRMRTDPAFSPEPFVWSWDRQAAEFHQLLSDALE